DAYSEAIRLDPSRAEDWLARATARIGLRDSNARADLDEARRRLAHDPRVATEYGRYDWLVERNASAAADEWLHALQIDARHVDARDARARMRLDRREWQGAEMDAAAVDRDAPTDPRGPLLAALAAIA